MSNIGVGIANLLMTPLSISKVLAAVEKPSSKKNQDQEFNFDPYAAQES